VHDLLLIANHEKQYIEIDANTQTDRTLGSFMSRKILSEIKALFSYSLAQNSSEIYG
jgi:hypothetical protein